MTHDLLFLQAMLLASRTPAAEVLSREPEEFVLAAVSRRMKDLGFVDQLASLLLLDIMDDNNPTESLKSLKAHVKRSGFSDVAWASTLAQRLDAVARDVAANQPVKRKEGNNWTYHF